MREIFEKHMNKLLAQGKSRARLTSSLNLFTRYLEETHLSWERFGVKEAQGLQTAFMALTDEQGNRLYASSTVVGCMLVVKSFYSWAKKKGLVAENPFLRVKEVKQPKKLPKDIYEPEEMDFLLSWLADFGSEPDLKQKMERYVVHVVAELMYPTGLTVGEVETLRPEDLYLSRRTVTVFIPRLKKKRTAFLSEYAAGVLSLFVEELRPVILISPNYRYSRHLLFGTGAELTKTVNRALKQ